jgi:transducin (beta)-like 1
MPLQVWRNPHKQTIPEAKLRGHTAPIVSIVWQQRADLSRTSARRALASASEDRTVRLWDVETMSCLRVLNLHLDPVEHICFTRDGTRLASAANGAVVLWDPDTGAVTHVYDRLKSRLPPDSLVQGNNSEVLANMDWDESGQRLALGGETGYGVSIALSTQCR